MCKNTGNCDLFKGRDTRSTFQVWKQIRGSPFRSLNLETQDQTSSNTHGGVHTSIAHESWLLESGRRGRAPCHSVWRVFHRHTSCSKGPSVSAPTQHNQATPTPTATHTHPHPHAEPTHAPTRPPTQPPRGKNQTSRNTARICIRWPQTR